MTPGNHTLSNPSRNRSGAEIKNAERIVFGKNRLLWVGVIAVMAPLIVLLVLQYSWLTDLERNSVVARRASLENYLQAISKETHFFFLTNAELALNLPPQAYTEETIQTAVHFFESRNVAGFNRLFIATFQPIPKLFFYEPTMRAMVEPDPSPEAQAALVAVSPWSALHKILAEVKTTELSVNEHDPERRIILNPITDEGNLLVAVAGLIVDQQYFTDRVLPDAVAQSLPQFDEDDALWVCIRDSHRRRVFPTNPCSSFEDDRVTKSFGFIFTDWTIYFDYICSSGSIGKRYNCKPNGRWKS